MFVGICEGGEDEIGATTPIANGVDIHSSVLDDLLTQVFEPLQFSIQLVHVV
jgi:hypothetical protein